MPRPGFFAPRLRRALRAIPVGAVVLLAGLASPREVVAQIPGGAPRQGPTPFAIGLRGGWAFTNSDWILGAHARVGLPGVSFLDVQVAGDLTFVSPPNFVGGPSFQERNLYTDLLYRTGTLAVGAGPFFRNTFWEDLDSPRETRTGWSGVAVLGGVPGPRSVTAFQLEYRYTRINGFGQSALTAGVSVFPTRIF